MLETFFFFLQSDAKIRHLELEKTFRGVFWIEKSIANIYKRTLLVINIFVTQFASHCFVDYNIEYDLGLFELTRRTLPLMNWQLPPFRGSYLL